MPLLVVTALKRWQTAQRAERLRAGGGDYTVEAAERAAIKIDGLLAPKAKV